MQTKSIKIELPEQLYYKIGVVASGRFETIKEYINKLVSESLREELELGDIKKQIASRYAADEVSYESLSALLGLKRQSVSGYIERQYLNHSGKRMMLQRG